MTTINDLLWDSITIQGTLIVSKFNGEDGTDKVLYDGDAESVGSVDDDWFLEEPINYIYPDPKKPDTLHIELQW